MTMNFPPAIRHATRSGRAGLTPEEAWALAESIQVTPTDTGHGRYPGTVTARPQATGWFISARSRRDLSVGEAAKFREFVTLRGYLLLTRGAQPEVWEPIAEGRYRAHPAEELLELESTELIPETVPAD